MYLGIFTSPPFCLLSFLHYQLKFHKKCKKINIHFNFFCANWNIQEYVTSIFNISCISNSDVFALLLFLFPRLLLTDVCPPSGSPNISFNGTSNTIWRNKKIFLLKVVVVLTSFRSLIVLIFHSSCVFAFFNQFISFMKKE